MSSFMQQWTSQRSGASAGVTTVTRTVTTIDKNGQKTVKTEVVSKSSDVDKPFDKPFPVLKSSRMADKAGTSSGGGGGTDDPKAFAKECLDVHNEYRAKHGVPPLTLSQKLCDYSAQWAKELAKKDKFEHRDQHDYGENIFSSWSTAPNPPASARAAVESWYSEIKDHKFGAEPKTLASGHFTQVVWKTTTEMGVSFARGTSPSKNGMNRIVVVANYSPPGNFIGKFAEMVPPPRK